MLGYIKTLITRKSKPQEEADIEAGIAASKFVRSIDMANKLLRRHFWVWPVFAFLLLAIGGYFVNLAIKNSLEARIRSELETLLHVECSMLERWLAKQENSATAIANNPELVELISKLIDVRQTERDRKASAESPASADLTTIAEPSIEETLDTERLEIRLRQLLLPGMSAHRLNNFIVVDTNGELIATQRQEQMMIELPKEGKKFFETVFVGGPRVSTPFLSLSMQMDSKGVVRGDVPIMRVAVPVLDATKVPIAALAFTIRPEREFTRILQLGKLGTTGETYAVNNQGLLISESRFNEELKLTGLIADQDDARSLLNIHVKDPGGDITAGHRPNVRRSELPLTFAAKSVIRGQEADNPQTGISLEGHRNYRGVPSVAAWKWLKGYNIGVITEMTTAEAFGPLTILQRVFYFLFALLTITFTALLIFSIVLSRIRQEARDAAIEAKQLGQYRLDTLIGRGAMGEVYKGQHSMMRRPTAIKLLKSDLVSDVALERFEHEVQLSCKLNNPHTVAIYDYGRTPDGVFYYAMEYLDGLNLQQLVDKYGPQTPGRAIHILTQIASSLYEAHSEGLVHRDIKPANIMINRRGGECDVVKVLDFGLVRSVSDTVDPESERGMAGTPMYMSPEAIQYPKSVDVRSDIYSLGAVGYYLLTGEPLYQVNNLGELFQQHIETTPESPSQRAGVPFPPELDDAIMACLQKSRSSRPQTAKEFATRLKAIELEEPWTRTDSESWWLQHERDNQEDMQFEHVSSLYGSNVALRSRARASTKRLNKPKTLRAYDATIIHESEDSGSDS